MRTFTQNARAMSGRAAVASGQDRKVARTRGHPGEDTRPTTTTVSSTTVVTLATVRARRSMRLLTLARSTS
jgi:hypothetical protein